MALCVMGFDRGVHSWVHNRNPGRDHLCALQKFPPALLQSVFFPPTPHPVAYKQQSILSLYNFAFNCRSYKWNHTVCNVLCLASFIEHNAPENHIYYCTSGPVLVIAMSHSIALV